MCLCVCACRAVWFSQSQMTYQRNEFGLLRLNTYNLPVGDVRRYFYSMAAGIQQERRNLSKYSFGATGRRNQSHKNRALNRAPLNWLTEMATPLQGGHREATLFSPGYNLDWIKSCSVFSQSWQLLFLNDTWYTHPAHPPSSHHSAGDTLEEGHVWEGNEKWMSGAAEECVRGSDARGCTSLPRRHTRLSPKVFVAVCVSRSTWSLTVREKSLTRIPYLSQPECYFCSSVLLIIIKLCCSRMLRSGNMRARNRWNVVWRS